jgi:hypothetical protein
MFTKGFLAVAAALVVVGVSVLAVSGSSHREAPLISKDTFADNTDTYVFIAPNNPKRIVLAASWIPFEGAEGGPNYFEWDDNARYYIYVDNDGDAKPDVTYTLSSQVQVANPNTFLYNTGPITSLADPDWNRPQRITVTETVAGHPPTVTVLVNNELTAPVNIGNKSTPNYRGLSGQAIYTFKAPNSDVIKVFGGQTDDAFFVDLQVFDLLTLRGQDPPIGYDKGKNRPVDSVSGYNVHSLVLEMPISRLKAGSEPVLGVWSGTSRPSRKVLSPGGQTYSGSQVQVSRLGMPLVNEVVIPLALKDAFNGLKPEDDLATYLAVPLLQASVEDPEVGNLLCSLYGVPLPEDTDDDCDTEFTSPGSGRGDIFQIFLTGMKLVKPFTINTASGPVTLCTGNPATDPTCNVNQPSGVQPAEMIRINTAISGGLCSPEPSRLGVLGGDACGFPNGRRLSDDTLEIELLAVAGAAYQVLDGAETGFTFNPALIGVLTDRVDENDVRFRKTFPYMAIAQSGQNHLHQNPEGPLTLDDSDASVAIGSGFLASGLALGGVMFIRRRRGASIS